jgi:hypothetical protein
MNNQTEVMKLKTERGKLVSRLDAIRADLGRGLNRNSSEQAIKLENQEVLTEIAQVTQEEINTIGLKLALQ